VTKECSQYTGAAGSFCTITSSNLNAIKVGSRVVYASASGDPTPGFLHTDLVVGGSGNNRAYGHVVLDLSTLIGVVTFSSGTWEFTHFHAGPIIVRCPADPECSWDEPVQLQSAQLTDTFSRSLMLPAVLGCAGSDHRRRPHRRRLQSLPSDSLRRSP
jgi:hypothetical protein